MRAREQIVYTCKIHSYESGEPQAQLWSSECLGLESPQLVASVAPPNTGHSGLAGLWDLLTGLEKKIKERITHKIQAKSQQTVASEGRTS